MLLDTMTYEEIYREAIDDSRNMVDWASHKMKDIQRASFKARKFPLVCVMSHTTPRRNRWTGIVIVNRKMRKAGCSHSIAYTSFHAKEGDIYIKLSPKMNGKMGINIYTPHFFQRVRERMGIDLYGSELAYRYFRWNDAGWFCSKPDSDHERCLCTPEGISLGEDLNDNMFLARTFIRYDMSLGWQRDAFGELQKRIDESEHTIVLVPDDYDKISVINEVYKERDRSKRIVFHH